MTTEANLTASLMDAVDELSDSLLRWRRDIHQHPEVSWQEHRTTGKIMDRLEGTGVSMRTLPGSGVIVDLGSTEPTTRVALRADLDALPLDEGTGLEFSSVNPGACHACGHDVHTAGVLGATLALAKHQDELAAAGLAVRCLFQPAEESMPGGAHTMMEVGALDGVDVLYAVHCDPSIDVGTVGLKVGPITAASDSVHVSLTGRGGHTSRPHLTQDLTYALGKVITDVPSVLSRRLDPRAGAALVWGAVRAGQAANVIPTSGECWGTLRMLDSETWDTTGPLIEEIVHAVVAPYGVEATIKHIQGVPPVDNDALAVAALEMGARTVMSDDAVLPTQQSLGGEDLGWYLTQVPGAMARLGTRKPGGRTYELHQGDLIVEEEATIYAAKLLAATVLATSARD